eukprot:5384534-Pyramimonas_sp.AAC.1
MCQAGEAVHGCRGLQRRQHHRPINTRFGLTVQAARAPQYTRQYGVRKELVGELNPLESDEMA